MKTMTDDRAAIQDLYARYPWIRQFVDPNRVRKAYMTEISDRILCDYPYSAQTLGGDFKEDVWILDKDGTELGKVGRLHGFAIWKFWLWIAQFKHKETVGEAILAARSRGMEPYFVLSFEDFEYHLTLYTDIPTE